MDAELSHIDVDTSERDPNKAVLERVQASNPDDGRLKPSREDAIVDRSRAMQKRIGRVTRQLTGQFDQRLAEERARHQREIDDLRADVGKLSARGESVNQTDAQHEAAMAALQTELEAAHDKGDSKKIAELTAKMNRLENQFWHNKTMAQLNGATAVKRQDEQKEQRREQEPERKQAGAPSASAAAWLDDNAHWYDDPEYAAEKAYADTLYLKALKAGEKDDDALFAKVTAKVKETFPDLEVDDTRYVKTRRAAPKKGANKRRTDFDEDLDDDDELDDVEDQVATRRDERRARAPVLGRDRAAEDQPRQGVTRINADQIRNMRAFGLDPDNNEHVAEYVRNARAS